MGESGGTSARRWASKHPHSALLAQHLPVAASETLEEDEQGQEEEEEQSELVTPTPTWAMWHPLDLNRRPATTEPQQQRIHAATAPDAANAISAASASPAFASGCEMIISAK